MEIELFQLDTLDSLRFLSEARSEETATNIKTVNHIHEIRLERYAVFPGARMINNCSHRVKENMGCAYNSV